jgi:hypothetical protein
VAEATIAEPDGDVTFSSPAELREVLGELLTAVNRDERVGPLLRAARARTRFEFTDMDLALNVASSEDPDRSIEWSFDPEPERKPKLILRMDSDVANRWLQGKESIAVAMARGRVRCEGESRSALFFLPTAQLLCEPYRRLVASKYTHLRVV